MALKVCPACLAKLILNREGSYSCEACKTQILLERRDFKYDDQYPRLRLHDQQIIQKNKVKSLASWIHKLKMNVRNLRVLELGYGSGVTLQYLKEQGADVYGYEPVQENIRSALELGIAKEKLTTDLKKVSGIKFNLFLFLDSFEHILEPEAELLRLTELSTAQAQSLVGIPRWDSWSRKWMGCLWPHNVSDHWIFYTQSGLCQLWERNGWRLEQRFYPGKILSLSHIFAHVLNVLRIRRRVQVPECVDFSVPLNFGEMGLLFRREKN